MTDKAYDPEQPVTDASVTTAITANARQGSVHPGANVAGTAVRDVPQWAQASGADPGAYPPVDPPVHLPAYPPAPRHPAPPQHPAEQYLPPQYQQPSGPAPQPAAQPATQPVAQQAAPPVAQDVAQSPAAPYPPQQGTPPPTGPVSWMEADLGDGRGPAAPPARRSPRTAIAAAVGAGVLLVGGFAVGQVFGGSGTSTTSASQQGPGGQQQGQLGQPGQGGPGAAGQQGGVQGQSGTGQSQGGMQGGTQGGMQGGPGGIDDGTMTVGQVSAVDGSTLTLTGRSGTVTVKATSSTSVDGTSGGDLSALTAGTLVFVQGTRASDGTWTATSISTTPPGMNGAQGGPQGGLQGGVPGGTQGGVQQGTQSGAQGTTT